MTPVDPDSFRSALAHWAAGVAIVACRVDGRVVATTVSAFMSLSVEPPQVLLAIGPNATVRPFLQPGASFGVSILTAGQRRLATIFADPLPVGPDPFGDDDVPTIPGSLATLACTVSELVEGGTHAVVIARVEALQLGLRSDPLIRFDRAYHGLRPL